MLKTDHFQFVATPTSHLNLLSPNFTLQDILPFCNRKKYPSKIDLDNTGKTHSGIDPNPRNLLCQLNNLS